MASKGKSVQERDSTPDDEKLVDGKEVHRPKAQKGTVKVVSDRGWLKLRFTYREVRRSFAIQLPDTPTNRRIAEGKANQVYLDIISGNFDETLEKYKPAPTPAKSRLSMLTVGELFEQFTEEKSKQVYHRTLEKYRGLLNHLKDCIPTEDNRDAQSISDIPVVFLGRIRAEQFLDYLRSQKFADRTIKEQIGLLSACWQWGITKHLWEDPVDIWGVVIGQIKVAPKQKPKPFSQNEIQKIIAAFRDDPHYRHYADYVQFLFATGCRTSEAIGLRWGHLTDDCSVC